MKIETFIGWESSPRKAAEAAQDSYRIWLGLHNLAPYAQVHVNAFVHGSGESAYFVHVITIQYEELVPIG